jgi:hypothetical protein
MNSACATSLSVCNANISTQCDVGYIGLVCAQCDSGWFSGKLSALECKTCAEPTLLVIAAIVSTLGVYGIGVALGQKAIDHVTQADDPTLDNNEHLKALKCRLKRSRDLNIVSSSFKMLMVHGTVISAVVSVDWKWQSTVKDMTSATTASSGSVIEFDFVLCLSTFRQRCIFS